MQFDAVIGTGRKTVSIEFEIDNFGQFTYFYVVAGFNTSPEDISGYLSSYEIDFLQFQCQMKHREKNIHKNESVISRTAAVNSEFGSFQLG